MRFMNTPVTWSDSTLDADRTSNPIHVGTQYNICVQVSVVKDGSIEGDFKIQISCDDDKSGTTEAQRASNVTNWTDLYTSSQEILDTGAVAWNISDIAFEWIRIVYTRTAGSGTVSARVNGRGV